MKTRVFLFYSLILLFSFCRKKRTIDCKTDPLIVMINGFSASEIDTVIIREISLDSNVTNPINVTMIRVTAEENSDPDFVLARLHHLSNWDIRIPGTLRSYYISKIKAEEKTTAITNRKDAECRNIILSSDVNGNTHGSIITINRYS